MHKLIAIVGINSTGKTTIANRVFSYFHEDFESCIIRESHLLMYLLGIINSYKETHIGIEEYEQLEKTDQSIIQPLLQTELPKLIKEIKEQEELVLYVTHLAFAFFTEEFEISMIKNNTFLTEVRNEIDGYIKLTAKPEDILQRRLKNSDAKYIDQYKSIEHIVTHQKKSDQIWKDLEIDKLSSVEIDNSDINKNTAPIKAIDFISEILSK